MTAPIGPPANITHEMSRQLIAALYEHDWLAGPAHDGRAMVFSPDQSRGLVVEVVGDRLVAYANGERTILSRAIDYVEGEA